MCFDQVPGSSLVCFLCKFGKLIRVGAAMQCFGHLVVVHGANGYVYEAIHDGRDEVSPLSGDEQVISLESIMGFPACVYSLVQFARAFADEGLARDQELVIG